MVGATLLQLDPDGSVIKAASGVDSEAGTAWRNEFLVDTVWMTKDEQIKTN